MKKVYLFIAIAVLIISTMFVGVTTNVNATDEDPEECGAPDALVCSVSPVDGNSSTIHVTCVCNHL